MKQRGLKIGFLVALFFCILFSNKITSQAVIAETYENFDYEAYANAYPDLMAAIGYDKYLLWEHRGQSRNI